MDMRVCYMWIFSKQWTKMNWRTVEYTLRNPFAASLFPFRAQTTSPITDYMYEPKPRIFINVTEWVEHEPRSILYITHNITFTMYTAHVLYLCIIVYDIVYIYVQSVLYIDRKLNG